MSPLLDSCPPSVLRQSRCSVPSSTPSPARLGFCSLACPWRENSGVFKYRYLFLCVCALVGGLAAMRSCSLFFFARFYQKLGVNAIRCNNPLVVGRAAGSFLRKSSSPNFPLEKVRPTFASPTFPFCQQRTTVAKTSPASLTPNRPQRTQLFSSLQIPNHSSITNLNYRHHGEEEVDVCSPLFSASDPPVLSFPPRASGYQSLPSQT